LLKLLNKSAVVNLAVEVSDFQITRVTSKLGRGSRFSTFAENICCSYREHRRAVANAAPQEQSETRFKVQSETWFKVNGT